MLFLIDLDGTLIDSEPLHHRAWANVLGFNEWYVRYLIQEHGLDYMLEDYPNPERLKKLKLKEMLKIERINLIKNADRFINYIVHNNINHVVVTNTNREVVEHFKKKVPILNKLKNWIVREDYDKRKPNPECYHLAVDSYGNPGDYIIGFEDSKIGLSAIKHVTPTVYTIRRDSDYLKIMEYIKIECRKKYGMHQINSNLTTRRKLGLSKIVFAMAGSLGLVNVLLSLKKEYLNYLERNTDSS
tara:strand:+ start:3143 stop:3871 length:729 start_codon:yes stop_codon:yes gene_type:complete